MLNDMSKLKMTSVLMTHKMTEDRCVINMPFSETRLEHHDLFTRSSTTCTANIPSLKVAFFPPSSFIPKAEVNTDSVFGRPKCFAMPRTTQNPGSVSILAMIV